MRNRNKIAMVRNMPKIQMNSEFVQEFAKLLKLAKGRKIAVVGHMRPDGDCVSSQFAMAEILRNAGAEVVCVNQENVPYLYRNFVSENFILADDFNDDSYEILLVDCSDLIRANSHLKEKFTDVFACVDHHASGNSQAQIRIIDTQAGATAEIIALCVVALDLKISTQVANLLFMGIATDTRQFTTTSTRVESLQSAKEMLLRGAQPNFVAQQLYQRERLAKMRLLSVYLDSLKMYSDNRICMGFIPLGTFENTGSCKEDTDGLVDYARSIEGVEIAITLEELADGSVKGSMRGRKPEYRVNEIAGHFGGGGHFAAAGFTAKNKTFETIIPELLELCEKSLK